MGSRKVEDLSPEMRKMWQEFDIKMKEAGIKYVITSTARSILEQMALYVQGRLPVTEVNSFRLHAGLLPIKESENKKVTWTLNSMHVTNLLDEDLNNNFSEAFDIAIVKEGQAVWDLKVDVNANDLADYEEAGIIGETVGLRWGGRFSSPDRPHFENPKGRR